MSHHVSSVERIWIELPLRTIPARNMVREIPHWTIFEICKVHLDSGVVGIGETMVYYTWGSECVTNEAIAKVVGRHPAETMWDDSLGAGLQIALFDAAAKVLDVPLHQMLGRRFRDHCHLAWWDIDLPAEDWISECRLAMSHGYTAFKTKGRPWWDLVENTRKLCATLPPHFEIDMDFNGFGVDTAHCSRLLKELEQFPQLSMYESPLPHHDVAGYKQLRKQLSMPISIHSATHFGEASMEIALREEMCDGFVLTGGASKIQREAHLCQAFNKSFFLQIVGTRIAAAFGLHLGAVLENARWPAINCHQLYETDYITEAIPVSNGLAAVPQGPGLGITLNEDAIEHYRITRKPKPYPHPGLLLAVRWPSGTTSYYAHTAQYWADWQSGRLPFFPKGVYLEHINDDHSSEWRELYNRVQEGVVHASEAPF